MNGGKFLKVLFVLVLVLIIFDFKGYSQSTIENTVNEDYWYVSKCGNSSYRKIASPFTTPSTGRIKITKVEVNSYDNNSNFLAYARIETSSSGSPTNTVVAYGTSNSVACSPAGWVAMTYTAGSQPILSASTTYFVVLSGTSGSTSTSCQFRTNNDLGDVSKWSTTTNCGSETWGACSSYGDLLYKIYYENADPTNPSLSSTGSSSQITFNNAYINDNTPLFRASATYSSTFDRFQIEVNTASDFTGTSYKQTFSNTYSSGTAYDLECTSLDNSWSPSNGTTYYVRVRASADGGSNYSPWSSGTYSYTYKTSGDVEWMQTTTAALGTSTLTHSQATSDYLNMSVTSGFTYGNSTDLGTNDNGGGYVVIQKIYATYDFTLQSLNVYFRSLGAGSKKYVLALYDDDGAGGIPGTRLAYTSEQTASATGLNSITPTSTPSLSTGYYYVAYTSNDANLKIAYSSSTGLGGGYVSRTYDATLPSTCPSISTYGTTYNYSFSFTTTIPQGTALSPVINYSSFNGCSAWQEVSWSETETNGNVKMQVWYDNSGTPTIVPDGAITGNSSGIASSPINISSLNTTTYSKLYLKALLTYSGGSPRLNDWKVTANYGSSNESDIVEAGFDESDNISYKDYQAASSLTTINSIKIGSFTIRDGGADLTDADANPTTLTDISFSVSNSSNIRALAIFDGATNLKEVTSVSATTTFSSISGLSASDNSSKTFDIYATFKTVVTDNQQIQLTVSSTTTSGSSSSLFATSNAGGATTSIAGDDNRIEVTATKLSITTEPSSPVCLTTNLSTVPVFAARDANDNTDLDFTGTVGLTNAGSIGMTGNSVAASAGVVTFTNLQFTASGSAGVITTTNSASLTNGSSSSSITVTGAPAVTTFSSHSGQTTTALTWNWNAVSGASTYEISYDGGAWTDNGAGTSYTKNTGITANTQHRLNIRAKNSCGTTGTASGDNSFYSSANDPTAPTVAIVSATSLSVDVNVNSNPASTEFAIYCNQTSNYVQADGSLGASAVWQTDAVWGIKNVTGLTGNTAYTFKVKARNGDGDETAFGSNSSSTTTPKIEPTNQATNFAVGTVTTSNIPLTWTAAVAGSQAPDGYLIKLNSSSVVDPVDGTDPANVTAITGGVANYKSTGTSYSSFTSWTAGTMYNFKLYSYTNSSTTIDFKTSSVPTINHATLPNPVTAQSITATGSTTANISWSAASGYNSGNHSTLVFVKATSSITAGTPTNAPSTYTANTVFGSGTAYQNDASAKCVYNGDGTSVSITGLSPTTTYYILIYTVVDASNSNSTNSYSSGATSNATTPCSPYTIPYSQGFETGFTNDASIAGCLSQEGGGDWYSYNDGSSYAHSGTWEAALYHNNTDWLFIPVTLAAGVNYSFSMFGKQDGSNTNYAKLTVKYGTTNTSAGMTSTIVSETGVSNSYQELSGLFSPSSTGTYYIGIKGYCYTDVYYYLYLDDISIVEIACPYPSTLTSSSITTTTATIGWTAPQVAPSEGYQYYYSQSSTAPVSGTTPSGSVAAGVVSANLTGLSPSATYYFWVRSKCNASDISDWVGAGMFSTSCGAATIPFFEGFETGFTDNVNVGGCYTQEDISGGYQWKANNGSAGGSPYAGTWNASLYHDNSDWMFFRVSLTAGANYQFSLFAKSGNPANLTVKYGTTGSQAGMTSGTLISSTTLSDTYTQYSSSSFSPSSTGTYYIGIYGAFPNSSGYFSIDNISIIQLPDANSKAEEPTSQIAATTISSINNVTSGNSKEVFKFKITDLATSDGLSTKVTNIRIKPGSNNNADWTDHIQGVKLYNITNSTWITIGSPTITDSYIDIPISSGNLDIADGASKELSFYIYLNTTNVIDNKILQFRIDYHDHGFTANNSGSQFSSTFGSADISGNNITVEVVATQLSFEANAPATAVALNSNFNVIVKATDIYGNTDNSATGNVTLSKASGTGNLTSNSGLNQSLTNGSASWSDVRYDLLTDCSSTFLTIYADHATLSDATTSCIQVLGAPGAFDFTTSNSSGCAGNFSITWSASSGATSYDLYYCEGTNCNPIYSTNIITGVTSGYSFNAVNANSEYNFAVLAKNVATETWSSSYIKRTTWTGNTWIGATNTNWSTASNWCGGVVPTSANDIVISSGLTHYPILTANASVNNITVEAGASLGLGSYTLNVYGNVDFSAGTLNAGTGTINMTAGNATILISNATTTVHNGDKFYDTGGTSGDYNSSQNITNVLVPENYGDKVSLKFISNNFDGDRLIIYDNNSATGNVLYDGTATAASIIGSFTATNSSGALTVQFISGAFFQYSGWEAEISVENPLLRTIDVGSNDLYHFEVNGRMVYINNNTLDVNGNLKINSGALYANGQNIELAGNWTNHAVFYPGLTTVTFDGSSNATIEKDGPTIIVYSTGFEDADGGTAGWYMGFIPNHTEWRRQSGAVAGNRIAPNNGTYDVGAYNLHDNTPGYYYTTDASKNCYATLSKLIDLRDVVDAQLSFFWYYQGGGPAGADSYNGMVSVDGIRFDHFLRWSTTWTQEVYDISDFCNKEALLAFDMNMLYVGEAPSNPGKYGYTIDNVVVTGTSCAESFNHIKINKSSGASVSLSSTNPTRINVEGDVFIESGTFKAQDNRVRCKGNFKCNGIFTSGSGDVVMNGSTTQSINGSQNISFYNLFKDSPADLIVGDASSSGKTIEVTNEFSWTDNNDKIIVGDGTSVTFKIASNMTIYNGCTLETKDNTIVSIAGNYTDYGILIPNKGMIKFVGNSNSYIIREPAEVLFIENFEDGNSNGWSFSGGSDDAEWIVHSGSSHNSTYDLATRGAGSYPVPYSFWADGSTATTTDAYLSIDLTGYSNVELQFYWKLGGKLNVQYGQLLIDTDGYGAGTSPILLMDNMYKQAQYTVSPRFDISQYANRVVTLIFRFISTGGLGGGNPGFCIDDIILTGTAVNMETFYDVSVDKGNNKSAVLRCPIDVDNDVTITNGDLNSGGISFPVGRNWSNLNTSTFTHQKNTITFDGNGEGKNQTITNNSLNKFFNVEINNSAGNVILASNRWYLDSNLTIIAGTFQSGTTAGVDDQDIYIHGHWKNIGGTFIPLNKTVFFRGVADQQLITNNSPFYNVTLPTEKENALILNDKLTINNNLLLTSGILDVKTNVKDIDINGHWLNNGGTFLHPNNTTTKVTFGGSSAQFINKKSDAITSPPGTTFEFNFSFDNVIINGLDVRFYVDSEGGKLLNVRNLTINANKKFNLIDD